MPLAPGNDLNLGILPGRNASLQFPRAMRDKHLYVCGGTGTGKSKFIENLIRQDIVNWRKSRSGLIVLDPHGSLYDSIIRWLAWTKLDRPVVPIDLRQDDWIVSYNMLRQREHIDPSVLIDNITDAMAYVWGEAGTNRTPLFARWVGNILRPLYQQKLTLIEAEALFDRLGSHIRYLLTSGIEDHAARQDWEFLSTLNPRDVEAQIGSTVNRFQRFIRNKTMRAMFGIPHVSLDLARALDEGHIILVSLATERGKISEENASLFGTLLLSDLWNSARERGKRDDVKPFYVYIDEFQEFVTPTIAKNLAEARGFGLHFTIANQFLAQVLDKGEPGKAVYKAIMENASSKVVFRLTDEENLLPMAKWLYRGTMNPDEIKHELYSTKVMAFREEMREVRSRSRSSSSGRGAQAGAAWGEGMGGTQNYSGDDMAANPQSVSASQSQFSSGSESENESWSENEGESVSQVPTLIPVFGKELAHVQFRSLEEQLSRAMAVLFDQQERHAVVRLVGMSAPVSIRTPDITKMPSSSERTKRFLDSRYATLPFAIEGAKARALLAERTADLHGKLISEFGVEATTSKRKLK